MKKSYLKKVVFGFYTWNGITLIYCKCKKNSIAIFQYKIIINTKQLLFTLYQNKFKFIKWTFNWTGKQFENFLYNEIT